MTVSYADLPSLLHDASLAELHWDRRLAEVRLDFADGLQRTESGQELEQTTLLLSGVRAIAAYEPLPRLLNGRKPDPHRPLLTEQELTHWAKRGGVTFSLNSRRCQFELESTDRREWLYGTADAADACHFNVHLTTEEGHLYVACETIECRSGGGELPLDTWSEECGQWWDAWKQYCDNRQVGDARSNTTKPAASGAPTTTPAELPQRPACVLESDAPPELLAPILDCHEGHNRGNWSRMCRGWPNFDVSPESRVAYLQSQHGAGPWVYLRCVDSWWMEGAMAYVQVRGVEHRPSADDGMPQNQETVIGYELRRFEDAWIIWNRSQGWIHNGSAKALNERQWWHDEWELGSAVPPASETPAESTDDAKTSSDRMPLPNAGRSMETANIAATALVSFGILMGVLTIVALIVWIAWG